MKVSSGKVITEKQGYEAMLYMLKTGEIDLTDILSGGEYITEDSPGDIAFWYY